METKDLKKKPLNIFKRLFDSTSKVILWISLGFCFYLVMRVLLGWEQGRDGAPEIIATVFGVVTIIISGYTWKSKQENVVKLTQQLKIEDKTVLKDLILEIMEMEK